MKSTFFSFWFHGNPQWTTIDEDVKFGLEVDNKRLYRNGINIIYAISYKSDDCEIFSLKNFYRFLAYVW
jgi:hypothetical protein